MKIKIQNKYNKDLGAYDKLTYDLEEREKVIFGRFSMTGKTKDGKFFSSTKGFLVFKAQATQETLEAFKDYAGQAIHVIGDIVIEQGPDGKVYEKFNIKEAKRVADAKVVDKHSTAKANAYVEEDDQLPPF